MKRYCFALDLIDDEELIKSYEKWHQKVWPQVINSIVVSGIKSLEIYRISNRLFMIMDTTNEFSLEKKAVIDANNSRVQEWEKLMWKFQKSLPFAQPDEKWVLMNKIFDLNHK